MLALLGNLFTPTKLLWLLRQLLQFGGVYLAVGGHASADDVARALGIFDAVLQPAGSAMFLIGFVGNIWASFRPKVTTGGDAIGIPAVDKVLGPSAARDIVQTAQEAIAKKPTLWESWFSKR